MDWEHVKKLFHEALRDPKALDGADPEVRAEVASLLAAHEEVPEEPAREGPGTVIDKYKLLQQIGEGGFGVVYMAEQSEPVRRKVALKIIKLGMDTKQVVARFEAERQALALMDHGNIAKVLDAGATETGRPYFVMELVKGVPITEYCDEAQLDTSERLALFQSVCHAVQHAHQKGIIHRDLKPSNVMVTLHDGEPVPKVIDFGIAKATDRTLTEKTLFTEFRQMIGTPEYMAPEQAEMSGLDVDTRADVYSLGVLLYELLTGSKPFDMKSLLEKGYDEVLRTIREVDPPKPSTRISTMGRKLTAVAKKRHTPPKLLGKLVRGDLDWIVMKALEKSRTRRYETANGLAMDIGRFLDDRPVLASPPGAGHRARKYIRRHKVGVTAVTLVVAALLVSGGLSYAGMREARAETTEAFEAQKELTRKRNDARTARATEEEQRKRAEAGAAEAKKETARAETVLDFVKSIVRSASPRQVKGRNYTVRQLLDDFDRELGTSLQEQPDVEVTVRTMLGNAYTNLGLYERGARYLDAAVDLQSRITGEEHPDFATRLHDQAIVLLAQGDLDRAEKLQRRGLDIRRRSLGDEHPAVAKSLVALGVVLWGKGVLAPAEDLLREALEIYETAPGKHDVRVAGVLNHLGGLRQENGDLDGAEELHRRALEIRRRELGDAHPQVAESFNNLGGVLDAWGRYDEALKLLRDALEIWREVIDDDHSEMATLLANMGSVLRSKREFEESEKLLRRAVEIDRAALGNDHPRVAGWIDGLARTVRMQGWRDPKRLDEAETLNREALDIRRRALPAGHLDIAESLGHLAGTVQDKRQHEAAIGFYEEALEMRRNALPEGHPTIALNLNNLAVSLKAVGEMDKAERCYREALAIWRKARGDRHRFTARMLSNLALLVRDQGKSDEAEKLLRKATTIQRRLFRGPHADLAKGLMNLASVLEDKEEAVELLREAIEIYGKTVGNAHRDRVRALVALSSLLRERKDYAGAENAARQVLAVQPNDGTLTFLGWVLLAQAKYEEAEKVLRESVAIRAKTRPGSWHYFNAKSLLGGALAGQGKYAEAEPLLVEGYEKMTPPEHLAQRKSDALDRVVNLYEAWGKPDKAKAWRAKR